MASRSGHIPEMGLDPKRNSLDTFRLIGALSVMYTHGVLHMDVDGIGWLNSIFGFFKGVPLFFALSGYLIWNSSGKAESFLCYAKKRARRIYPELWLGIAVELVVLLVLFEGPIRWAQLGLFALCQGTFLQFWTPDFLRGYGCGTPNGSLWTICTLIQFYILIYPFHRIMRQRKLWVWLTLLAVSILIGAAGPILEQAIPQIVYKLYQQTLIPYLWLFMLGMFVGEKRDVLIPFLRKWWPAFALVSVGTFFVEWDIVCGHYNVLRSYGMILAVLGFAYRFPGLAVKRDISYGIYIYHMTVVNGMIVLGAVGKTGWVFLMMALSCILAYASTLIFHPGRGRGSKKRKGDASWK